MISRVLAREGANGRVSGMFYKAVVMSVLLYGSESWVWTDPMVKTLEGFHNRITRRLAGMGPTRSSNGDWVYPPIAEAREASALHSIQHYINARRTKVWNQVETRPIFARCCESERLPGSPTRQKVWWDQKVVGPPETEED